VLSKHRGGLNAIARALLDNEIIDGAEVARLVDEAHGSPVHGEGVKSVPHFNGPTLTAPDDLALANGSNGAAEVANGAGASLANGHAARDEADPAADGPVAVPASPAVPTSTARPTEADVWPPPPWPPAEPGTATPEGSTGG
jgi:hypothetical protein